MILYHHFFKEDEGWYSSFNGKLIVEREVAAEDKLKLISAPGYHPSFKRGLHKIRILKRDFGVNKVNVHLTEALLD